MKWQLARDGRGDLKYMICNADEGDPGAFMDRSVLEGDPHAVLEGMAIAAYAIGASEGYVYVRAEYPLAVKRLRQGDRATPRSAGYLGEDIIGTGFSFTRARPRGRGRVRVRRGDRAHRLDRRAARHAAAAAAVPDHVGAVGQAHLHQQRRDARERRVDHAQRRRGVRVDRQRHEHGHEGLRAHRQGPPQRAGRGADGPDRRASSSTTSAAAARTARRSRRCRSAGRAAAACPAELFDTPIEYDALAAAGAIVGSGGMVVVDETTCMVDLARYFLTFTQDESCGKCVPCRIGTKRMLEIVTRITEGKGEDGDIEKLERARATSSRATSLCGLGQTAPNPVLTTLRYFRDEYEEHIFEKQCRARRVRGALDLRRRSPRRARAAACARSTARSTAISGALKEVARHRPPRSA